MIHEEGRVEAIVKRLIDTLGLEPLPVEGGYFRQSYRSKAALMGGRPAATAIYFLLTAPDGFSALHRLDADELFHFYLGDTVESLFLYPDGRMEHMELGQNIFSGQKLQALCPAGTWQGHRIKPGGTWALIGSTMAPGFSSDCFTGGERTALMDSYPEASELIAELTRPGSDGAMPEGY
ncbi:cupin domain-containing protein [Sediminispirochaeta bajacaliforniensis]|uniref:cupin domain-containing protein n=1 Tax=Sediminispirochaeta bajacaliforniensis TaxID=148 RepID=UPI0003812F32|nr:cupin domain-containing protein [Sediminispirochaeta bajacaliforniensis]